MKTLILVNILLIAFSCSVLAQEKPNILWITSEDNSSFLGCYGDPVANTPNLDALAENGIRYTNCFSNAAVCAPMRSSWIQGLPAVSSGTHNMRSFYRVPDSNVPYPVLFKKAGYYVTNNSKTDYNTSSITEDIWDQCGGDAHYKNRNEGQPFFAVFNLGQTHEGQIFEKLYPGKYPQSKVKAEKIKIPPYQYPCTETFRDWQRVYARIASMDTRVGKLLKELEESGEAENTIVIYNSDHGGIMLRSKRFLFDSGTRVPLIISAPEKWKHLVDGENGTVSERLTQFIDLPRTYLSWAGIDIAERIKGSVISGANSEKPDSTVFLFSGRFDEAPDMRRAVTDGTWRYIRNYEPDRPRFQMLGYPLGQAGQVAQWKAYKNGKTNSKQSAQYLPQVKQELFNTSTDKHEVNNLVNDTVYAEKLAWLQQQLDQHILDYRDAGFIPEPMLAAIDADASTTIYEFCQDKSKYPLKEILQLANLTNEQRTDNISVFQQGLQNENPVIRYWSILGLRILGEDAEPALKEIKKALKDKDESVRITAAIAYANLGYKKPAVKLFIKEAKKATNDAHANWALDGLRYHDAGYALEKVKEKDVVKGKYSKRTYDMLKAGGSMYRPVLDK